jgi:hypothetical protein
MIDPLIWIPDLVKQQIIDGVVDYLSEQAQELLGEQSGKTFSKLKSDAGFQKDFNKAVERATSRFERENLQQDEDLVVAIRESKDFWQKRNVQKALLDMLKRLGRWSSEGDELALSHFDDILPSRVNRERVDQAVDFLLQQLAQEVWHLDKLRPIYELQSGRISAQKASEMVNELHNLHDDVGNTSSRNDKYEDLTDSFAAAPADIRDHIIDFTRLIEEKTLGFVGRDSVFDAISEFIENNPRGYIIISCDPGVGKTALAAQIVRIKGYVHHFNVRAEGIVKPNTFLENVCSQLIAAYQLPYNQLPPEASYDSGYLYQLLRDISEKLEADEKAVIVVDALDEADSLTTPSTANVLHLPTTLPPRIYIIATMRKAPVRLLIHCESSNLSIESHSSDNTRDVQAFLARVATQPHVQDFIKKSGIDTSTFVKILTQKSEGNFLYLHYVLSNIENYDDLKRILIPEGLYNYYEDHWRRIRGQDTEAWFDYKLPIISTLAVIKEPISIDLIGDFSAVTTKILVREALAQWSPFLHEEVVERGTSLEKRYSIYHSSFQEFIAQKAEIKDERVSLKAAHSKIVDTLWSELFDNE